MAKNIGYFARFCEAVARHLTAVPALGPMVAGKLKYLIEDMDDAIDMADGDGVSAAQEALAKLRTAAAAAGV